MNDPFPIGLEWVAVVTLLAVAVWPLLTRAWRSRPGRLLSGFALFTVLGTLGVWGWHRAERSRQLQSVAARLPAVGRPGGYVSSDTCQACHPDAYESWHRSYHRTMTQFARPDTVLPAFEPQAFAMGDGACRIWRTEEGYWAELPDPERFYTAPGNPPELVRRRIGLVTGSHHMQIFWVPSEHGNQQIVFPFAWIKEARRWAPVQATFLRDPQLPPFPHVWNSNCMKCHATGGQPRLDRNSGIMQTRVAELGIACESCHGPGERHVDTQRNPWERYAHSLLGRPVSDIVHPGKLVKERSAEVCGQCHGIKWIPHAENFPSEGFSYRPGAELERSTPIVQPSRIAESPGLQAAAKANPGYLEQHFWPDGMVRVSGREYNGLIDSPCFQRGSMTCLTCHSMHRPVSSDDQLHPGAEGDGACIGCHEKFRERPEAHTHHARGSAGSQCMNCHMPHTTYGLLKAIRSHQVTSPDIAVQQQTGRPNACNLCHLDRTLEWTQEHLVDWYGRRESPLGEVERQVGAGVWLALCGDAGQRALAAWHMGWQAAGEAAGRDWMVPYLAELLRDPYSAVRYIALRSLRRLPGYEDVDFDPMGPPGEGERARSAVIDRWKGRERAPASGESRVLITAGGQLDGWAYEELLRQRDQKSMDLQE